MKKRRDTFLFWIVSAVMVLSLFAWAYQGKDAAFQMLDETVTDIDGNVYHTVKIGDQIWMAENLKVTRYRDGAPIPNVYENEKWPQAVQGAFCMVDNDSIEYKKMFGLLYNFYAVVNPRQLCPRGWHVPSEEECRALINFLGGPGRAGMKIKDNRSGLWESRNANATNESGFSGLPAGGRGRLGSPADVGHYATW